MFWHPAQVHIAAPQVVCRPAEQLRNQPRTPRRPCPTVAPPRVALACATARASPRATDSIRRMTTHVALLRGINVGGKNMVAMADLRALLDELGLTDGKSLLQSGNLVFRSERRTAAALEKLLEKEASRRLG